MKTITSIRKLGLAISLLSFLILVTALLIPWESYSFKVRKDSTSFHKYYEDNRSFLTEFNRSSMIIDEYECEILPVEYCGHPDDDPGVKLIILFGYFTIFYLLLFALAVKGGVKGKLVMIIGFVAVISLLIYFRYLDSILDLKRDTYGPPDIPASCLNGVIDTHTDDLEDDYEHVYKSENGLSARCSRITYHHDLGPYYEYIDIDIEYLGHRPTMEIADGIPVGKTLFLSGIFLLLISLFFSIGLRVSKDELEMAKKFEETGEWDRAVKLYKGMGMNERIGDIYLKRGDPQIAFVHYLDSGNWDKIMRSYLMSRKREIDEGDTQNEKSGV